MKGFEKSFDKGFSKNSGSGFNYLLIGVLALIIVYIIITAFPVAIDKDGATHLDSLSVDSLFGQSSSQPTASTTVSTTPTLREVVKNSSNNSSNSNDEESVSTSTNNESLSSDDISVYFCPQDSCASELIKRIDKANSSIYLAIYSFTHDDIGAALLRAKERGVTIEVVFDYDQSKNEYSEDEKLLDASIQVKRMDGSGYMHNKFMILDGSIVSTGSFNYSNNADTKNNENLIFIKSEDLAMQYKNDFDLLWEKAAK